MPIFLVLTYYHDKARNPMPENGMGHFYFGQNKKLFAVVAVNGGLDGVHDGLLVRFG